MALLDQFIQSKGQLTQQAGQEAEQARFLETSNLRSTGIGALEALNRSGDDRTQFLMSRVAEIESRGGDPRDTQELLSLDPEGQERALQGVVQIAQQAGALQAPKVTKPVETAEEAARRAGLKETELLKVRAATPEAKAERAREEKQRTRDETERVKKEEAIQIEARGAVDLITDLSGSDLDLIFGREEQFKPQRARSQAGLDLQAKRKRIVSLLELGAAGKLKGQGQITEAERRILSDSVGLISNELVSPELAEQEFERIRPIFEKIAGTAQPATIGRFQIKVK
jgi:hypothetical protein